MALGAMSGFAGTTILAKFAYAAGANALTLLMFRHLFVPAALAAYFLVRGRKMGLPRAMRNRALLLGGVLACNSIGYIGSVRFIPVSLAVLIFYTYPLIVALVSRLVDKKPLGRARVAALVCAFAGLGLLLGAGSHSTLDWRGVALASLAAISLGNVLFWSDRLLGQAHAHESADPLAVKFHLLLGCGAGVVATFLVLGDYVPPATEAGWLSVAGFAVLYLLSFVTLFTALPMLGAVKASLLANIEPVVTLVLAALLLGERLAPAQAVGGALVIGAIVATQLGERRGPPLIEPLD
jgi:drug/metabolite transporter (DMT)-like permease